MGGPLHAHNRVLVSLERVEALGEHPPIPDPDVMVLAAADYQLAVYGVDIQCVGVSLVSFYGLLGCVLPQVPDREVPPVKHPQHRILVEPLEILDLILVGELEGGLLVNMPPHQDLAVVASAGQPPLPPVNSVTLFGMSAQQLNGVLEPNLVDVDYAGHCLGCYLFGVRAVVTEAVDFPGMLNRLQDLFGGFDDGGLHLEVLQIGHRHLTYPGATSATYTYSCCSPLVFVEYRYWYLVPASVFSLSGSHWKLKAGQVSVFTISRSYR